MEYDFTRGPDAGAEIKNLLDYNGFYYREDDGGFAMTMEDRGCRWNCLIMGEQSWVTVTSCYPFRVEQREAEEFCSRVNRMLVFGSMYWAEGTLVCRTSADIFDGYMAYEAIGRALEYNAGVMVEFWADAAALEAGK